MLVDFKKIIDFGNKKKAIDLNVIERAFVSY